jgi:hypothetical protein
MAGLKAHNPARRRMVRRILSRAPFPMLGFTRGGSIMRPA